jgi:hypothetical protein
MSKGRGVADGAALATIDGVSLKAMLGVAVGRNE